MEVALEKHYRAKELARYRKAVHIVRLNLKKQRLTEGFSLLRNLSSAGALRSRKESCHRSRTDTGIRTKSGGMP
jgi:hypothetical protein